MGGRVGGRLPGRARGARLEEGGAANLEAGPLLRGENGPEGLRRGGAGVVDQLIEHDLA